MRFFRNYNTKENVKFIFILKFFALILLTRICYLNSYKSITGISLENEYKVQGMTFECFNRLLAKREIQNELKSHKQREFLSDNIMNKNMKNVLEYTSTFGQLNKRKTDLDSYMKGYKRRYSKKNGLGKLECYCEKKVFDKIEDIDKIVEKMQNYKKLLKQKVCYNFGIRFILFSLVPFFGLIIPLVFYGYLAKKYTCFKECQKARHRDLTVHVAYKHNDDEYLRASIDKKTWGIIEVVNFTFLCVSMLIVVSVIIYLLIKFIKYQRLKACRSKMSIKEYCKFCKSLFV